MPRKAAPRYVRAIQASFYQRPDGEWVDLNPNEIVLEDDPRAKERPDLFQPLEPSRQRPAVEQATAAPGEVRS